jgi:Raf kinase inhibitor-like YbhB/YbcL family protein
VGGALVGTVVIGGLLLTSLTGCGFLGDGERRAAAAPGNLTVSSPAFRSGQQIPARYTCRGEGVNPALRWSGLPAGTKAIAIVVDDPDAPSGPYVHWTLFNIDPHNTEIAEDSLPTGAQEARTSAGSTKYAAPCPTAGSGDHHYRFSVYALDARLPLRDDAGLTTTLRTIPQHVIARGRLTGVVRG